MLVNFTKWYFSFSGWFKHIKIEIKIRAYKRGGLKDYNQSQLETFWNIYDYSVTRFSQNLLLWQNFKRLWQFSKGLFGILIIFNLLWQISNAIGHFFLLRSGEFFYYNWANISNTIEQIFPCYTWPNIEISNLGLIL